MSDKIEILIKKMMLGDKQAEKLLTTNYGMTENDIKRIKKYRLWNCTNS